MQLALQIVLIISSVLLVLLILLHRGRGGGLSSLFGGGVQSSLSGSSVVEKNLDRLTLFVQARNITNEDHTIYEAIGDNVPVIWRRENYGANYVFGVRGQL